MSNLSKKKFKELATITAPHCISIYFTTTRGKIDSNKINLKNHLKKVRKDLESQNLTSGEIGALTKNIEALFDDIDFWQKLSNGLALLAYDGKLTIHLSDRPFISRVYVANHLYLVGLAKELDNKKDFYLLVLGANNIRFFRGDDEQIKQIELPDLPGSMEEVVGGDVRQKSLQYRSGQGEAGGGMYHGHGSGSDSEKKLELTKFFRVIDDALNEELEPVDEIPLLVASEKRTFHLYEEVNSYPYMAETPIQGNHEESSESELHKICIKWMRNQPAEKVISATQQFNALLNKGESSTEIPKIIGAAFQGQIATLFANEDSSLYGYLSPEKNEVTLHGKSGSTGVDLINFSVIHTIMNDGQVLLPDKGKMPDPTASLNAVFRYAVA